MSMPVPEAAPVVDLAALKREMQAAKEDLSGIDQLVRLKRDAMEAFIAGYRDSWATDNAELLTNYEAVRWAASEAELKLRAAVVQEYELSGRSSKQIAPALGLSVQVRVVRKISDHQKAYEWARGNPGFLITNEKAVLETAKNQTLRETLGMNSFLEEAETVVAVIKE